METRKRASYSQNFIRDARLVRKLILQSSLNQDDTIIEIGAGNGIITAQLARECKHVLALEKDPNLHKKLVERFKDTLNVECILADFLTFELPASSYKIFSNIPFSSSADIVKKITMSKNPPDESYLITQYEFSKKYVGKPIAKTNSQISILLKPWFDFSVFYKFRRGDFYPRPGVDTVMIKVTRINPPLVDFIHINTYRDFIVYAFNQFRANIVESLSTIINKEDLIQLNFFHESKPSELHFTNWLDIFNLFLEKSTPQQKRKINGAYVTQLQQQQLLEKRTRVPRTEFRRQRQENFHPQSSN